MTDKLMNKWTFMVLLLIPVETLFLTIYYSPAGYAFATIILLTVSGLLLGSFSYARWKETIQFHKCPKTFTNYLKSLYSDFRMKFLLFDVRNSRELALCLLDELGAEREDSEEGKNLFFEYNDRKYCVEPVNAGFINIVSVIGQLELDKLSSRDIEKLKETVNDFNLRSTIISVYFDIDTMNNRIVLYGIIKSVFTKDIKNIKGLFTKHLDLFGDIASVFNVQYQLKLDETEESDRAIVQ